MAVHSTHEERNVPDVFGMKILLDTCIRAKVGRTFKRVHVAKLNSPSLNQYIDLPRMPVFVYASIKMSCLDTKIKILILEDRSHVTQ
mmetsp:Transcript_1260/g.1755  ORF Transcript_1260/g.1755 Transcript_1260/m.1755 type:complete len:87 (-) Transcript_1260:132-392(-)